MFFTYVDGLLEFLDVLLELGLAAVGLVEGDLELVDILLQLLLDAHGLSLALGFSLQGSLHGIQGALVVAAANKEKIVKIDEIMKRNLFLADFDLVVVKSMNTSTKFSFSGLNKRKPVRRNFTMQF